MADDHRGRRATPTTREARRTVRLRTDADAGVEVSPLISYGGEGLDFLKGREIKAPAVIEKEE